MSAPAEHASIREEPSFRIKSLEHQLRTLVRTRSINPEVGEQAMCAEIARQLGTFECEVNVVESLPDRHSIAAVVRCERAGPRLVLNGHMDTVGIDDSSTWSADPFAGEVREGFLYGRGACDMKAGLAVILAVGRYVSAHRHELKGELVLHFAIGEERGEPGTASLIAAGFGGDRGIVAEPSELNVAVAQRGLAFYDVVIPGRSAHASRPEIGVNPILAIPAVLEVLASYEREVGTRTHSLLPPGTCTPTMVRAGVQPNSLADQCEITIDRRLVPGETPEGELASLEQKLAAIPGVRVSVRSHRFRPAEVDPDCAIASQLVAATTLMTERPAKIRGAPYATDCSVLVHDGGMEAVVFGPGDPRECHCPDERVSLTQLRDAALVMAKVAVDALS